MLIISDRKKSERKSIQSQTLYLGDVISAVAKPACENPYLPFKIFGCSTNMLDLTVVKAVHPKVLLTVTNLNLLAKLYFVNLTFLLPLELSMRNSYFSGLHVNIQRYHGLHNHPILCYRMWLQLRKGSSVVNLINI